MIRIPLSVISLLTLFSNLPPGASLETRNVVLLTVDGVRWQELFTGADRELLDRKKHGELIRRLVVETPEERREALMPFFWDTLAPRGMVFGNRLKGSGYCCRNRFGVSACLRAVRVPA